MRRTSKFLELFGRRRGVDKLPRFGRRQPIADDRIGRDHLAVDVEQDGVTPAVTLDEVAAADRDFDVAIATLVAPVTAVHVIEVDHRLDQ
jgi:hypothetical protein